MHLGACMQITACLITFTKCSIELYVTVRQFRQLKMHSSCHIEFYGMTFQEILKKKGIDKNQPSAFKCEFRLVFAKSAQRYEWPRSYFGVSAIEM